MKYQKNMTIGISLESEFFYLNLIKTLIKILFSSNFGMQYRQKFGIIQKNNKNSNPFENSKEYDYWDFTSIELIFPKSYINIDQDTIFMKFWNANIGKNLGLFKKIIII